MSFRRATYGAVATLTRQCGRQQLEREPEVEPVALAQLDLKRGEALQQASVVEPAGVQRPQSGGLD
jgi:hypothetical protein